MMVRGSQATRRFRVIAAIALLICVLALLVPHSAGQGLFIAGVLFFPVFLFGLLDPPQWLRIMCTEGILLPTAPVRSALFQRPPPTIN
jgi:hypothetical protein